MAEGERWDVPMTAVATWRGHEIARSDDVVIVEGNRYFPREDVRMDLLESSPTRTTCHWKGDASYFSVAVDGEREADVAWTYETPSDAATEIAHRLAFWRGVRVHDEVATVPDDIES
jgi:uncharacterized protein (DUF427 family)